MRINLLWAHLSRSNHNLIALDSVTVAAFIILYRSFCQSIRFDFQAYSSCNCINQP